MRLRAEQGFTLVEVLVVLALTGMISVLLLQMVTLMLRGYDQVGRIQSRAAIETMQMQWFRETIGVLAASLDEEFALQGTTREINGFTMAPLLSEPGELTRIQWRISDLGNESVLWYQEGDEAPLRIGSWPGKDLAFAYRGRRSDWLPEWPAGDLPAGVLPYRIKLSISGPDETRDVYAAINVRRLGRYDYRDLIN